MRITRLTSRDPTAMITLEPQPRSAPVLVYLLLSDRPHPVAELRAAGLSEPAVWQAVCRLRHAGHDIRYLGGQYHMRSKQPLAVQLRDGRIELKPT